MVRLVSENTEAELVARRAADAVGQAVRDVAANLMRIARGAGRPLDLPEQLDDLRSAMAGFQEATGRLPRGEFADMLRLDVDRALLAKLDALNSREYLASRQMMRGALQMAASELLDQKTQHSAGQSELYAGAREREGVLDEWRREAGIRKRRPRKPTR